VYFPLLNCPKRSTYAIYPLSSFLPPVSSSRTAAVLYPISSFLPPVSSSRTAAVLYPTHWDAMPFPVREDTLANSVPQSENPPELQATTYCLDCHYNSPRNFKSCGICNKLLKRIASGTSSITSHLSSLPDASSSAGRLGTKASNMIKPEIENMKRERIEHDAVGEEASEPRKNSSREECDHSI